MNKSKIVYLIESPFNKRDYKRFGIEVFIERNFDVEIWDLTSLLYPDVLKKYKLQDPILFNGLIKFTCLKDFIVSCKKLNSKSIIINILTFNINSYLIFLFLTLFKIKYAILSNEALALPKIKISNNLMYRARNLSPSNILASLFLRIPLSMCLIKKADYIICGGEETVNHRLVDGEKTIKIWTHCFDYDFILKDQSINYSNPNYIVFLDQYFPYHPDIITSGEKRITDHNKYYPAISNFFSYIEEKTGLNVVIAAHPKSDYSSEGLQFGGRKIIKNNTIELVKNSALVLLHGSTAMNLAIIYRKPMIFITSDDFDNQAYGERWKYRADLFGQDIVNIDNINFPYYFNMMTIKEKAYNEYLNKYIKKEGSSIKPIWEIVADEFAD